MKIENAKITLILDDPNEILMGMSEEERLEFYQSLSCHDEVIENVMKQVFEGCTDDGYYGGIACTWNGSTELQKFRKKLIEVTADEATKSRIDELERYCKRFEERNSELIDEINRLKGYC